MPTSTIGVSLEEWDGLSVQFIKLRMIGGVYRNVLAGWMPKFMDYWSVLVALY
jgi:hypothetical protein